MKVRVLAAFGLGEALLGMGLSHGVVPSEFFYGWRAGDPVPINLRKKLIKRAKILATKDGGHNKFLESIKVWVAVQAPRYWWQEADTYRLSTKQSESTMHTLLNRKVTQNDFENWVPVETMMALNETIHRKSFHEAKNILPEGFLQTRVWCLSVKTLRNIYAQRINHRLPQWKKFLDTVVRELDGDFDATGILKIAIANKREGEVSNG